ncbi:MAG TPA: hypothetical protein VF820_05590 [Patescibacteria group bacterium]
MFFKGLYSILLGLFLTVFISVGIATFYPQPSFGPISACAIQPASEQLTNNAQNECTIALAAQQKKQDFYIEVVSSIALISAVIFFAISMFLEKKKNVYSYGFLFGSIFTLLYSNARGLNTSAQTFKFTLITISLVLVLVIGYINFIKAPKKKK